MTAPTEPAASETCVHVMGDGKVCGRRRDVMLHDPLTIFDPRYHPFQPAPLPDDAKGDKLRGGYVLKDGEDFLRDVIPVRCRAAYEKHIGTVRSVAREHGYAIGVHGSLARDMDLIAVPWVDDAKEPKALALAIEHAVGGVIDNGSRVDGPAYDFATKPPAVKPHGRLCWSIHLGGGPYIDLSVIPPADGGNHDR